MDIAWQTMRDWQGLPLSDLALDTKFLEGPRLEEFRATQFRLRLLSVFLHETLRSALRIIAVIGSSSGQF